VAGGVPLARGLLRQADEVSIWNARGEEVPAHVRPLATWPDGSLKWVFCQFLAMPGENYALKHSPNKALTGTLTVQRSEAGVTVDTGPLRFTVAKDGSGFLDEVWLNGEALVRRGKDRRNVYDLLHLQSPDDYPALGWPRGGTSDPSRLEVTHIEVEEAGPLRAVLCLRGRYWHTLMGTTFLTDRWQNRGSEHTLRLYAYSGESFVRIFHTFVYEGEEDHDFVQEVSLSLPLELSSEKKARATSAACDWKVEEWLYAEPHHAQDRPNIPNPGGEWPFWRLGGVLQSEPGYYRVWKGTRENNAPLTMVEGSRAPGWMDLSDDRRGVTFGVRDFWQLAPKGLEASNDTGRISIGLYPRHLPPLDLRRYSDIFGTGEDESHGLGRPQGIAKTHECYLYFHRGRRDEAEASAMANFLGEPAFITVPAEYLAETRVIGPFAPAEPNRFPAVEQNLTDYTDFMLASAENFSWYGMLNFGDIQHCYLTHNKNQRFENDWGRWAWSNDEANITWWFLLHALRTGRPDWFRFAEAMAWHVRDVDVCHSEQYVTNFPPHFGREQVVKNAQGEGKRHNVQHWGDGYLGTRVAVPTAQRIYYYMTADGRTADCMEETLSATLERVKLGGSDCGTYLYALLVAWERTGDPRYGHILGEACRYLAKHLAETGKGVRTWHFDFSTGKPTGPVDPDQPHSFFLHAFGLLWAMEEYADLTGDDAVKRGLVAVADACYRTSKTEHTWSHDYCLFRTYATAYRYTRDPKYLGYLREVVGDSVPLGLLAPAAADQPGSDVEPPHRDQGHPQGAWPMQKHLVSPDRKDWRGPRLEVYTSKTSIASFAMTTLPYALWALSAPSSGRAASAGEQGNSETKAS
jgi:hypothetical protein